MAVRSAATSEVSTTRPLPSMSSDAPVLVVTIARPDAMASRTTLGMASLKAGSTKIAAPAYAYASASWSR
jgi:hypothetical protein